MLFSDVNFVIHNEENVVSDIPLLSENLIYVLLMSIPFLILLSIRFLLRFVCKKRGIMLPSTLRISRWFKIKGSKAMYFKVFIGIILFLYLLSGYFKINFCIIHHMMIWHI